VAFHLLIIPVLYELIALNTELAIREDDIMSFNLTWENAAQTVLRFESDGTWTWEEYDKAFDQTCELVNSVDHKVNVLFIQSKFTPNGSPIPHVQRTTKLIPHNVSKLVMVGGSLFLRSLYEVMVKVNPRLAQQIIFANTLDEAHLLIGERSAA
jgi:hypothetical protein